MTSKKSIALLLCSFAYLTGCGQQDAPVEAAVKPAVDPVYQSPGKPNVVPVEVKYRLLNIPKVGEPVNLELTFVTSIATPSLGYNLESEDGLVVAQNAAAEVFSAKLAQSPEIVQVSVTPMREGRFYLRVNANVIANGRMLTKVVTIPIQVGLGTRDLQSHGELGVDANGDAIVKLPATEN